MYFLLPDTIKKLSAAEEFYPSNRTLKHFITLDNLKTNKQIALDFE